MLEDKYHFLKSFSFSGRNFSYKLNEQIYWRVSYLIPLPGWYSAKLVILGVGAWEFSVLGRGEISTLTYSEDWSFRSKRMMLLFSPKLLLSWDSLFRLEVSGEPWLEVYGVRESNYLALENTDQPLENLYIWHVG